jgi:DNA-directed RNA polymerase subunit RPC12/RpoP
VPAGAPVGKVPAAKADAEPVYSCEHCGKATMKSSDFKCPACGAEYAEGKDEEDNPIVMLAKRPCTKCQTLIELPDESPGEAGQKGTEVKCPSCGAVHFEERVVRTERPCENPLCEAVVPLTAHATCNKCGKQHELGEKDAPDAPAEFNAWVAVAPVEAEKPKAPTSARRVRR